MAHVIRAVLFDLDGTMVDNMRFHVDAWMEIGKKLGRDLTPEYIQREFSGRKNEELFPSIAGRPMDSEELERLAEEKESRYRELYAPHMALVDGLDAFLKQLVERRIAVGIATAAPRKNRDFILEGSGLGERIHVVVGAEQVKRGKPEPDLFLEAARQLGCDPQATLVFEDAVLGVRAGRAAGMSVCGVTTSEPRDVLLAEGAEFAVGDFTELPEQLIARLDTGFAGE